MKNLKFISKIVAFIFFVVVVLALNKVSGKFTYIIGSLLGLEEA